MQNSDKLVLGDNILIGMGANIVGYIHVGNNVTIGANSVVIEDVANDKTIVGIPAKSL